MKNLDTLYLEALELLQGLTTQEGIMASSIESDNYKRVWARDSVLAGIAGILADDNTVINGLKTSLLTLSEYQQSLGMIPSNVEVGKAEPEVSYGSLVGRVDTNTWFIIGALLYYKHSDDKSFLNKVEGSIHRCYNYLRSIEFNAKGWLYTPMSGNWADEYPIHGYTLYDNCLYLWAKSLMGEIGLISLESDSSNRKKTLFNFWPIGNKAENIYQEGAYKEALVKHPSHFLAFIQPGMYDTRFDAAANAMALLQFKLNNDQKGKISNFIDQLKSDMGQYAVPAFWPVMTETSWDWNLLKGNYSYNFKNTPHNFHNGGIWPIWTGLFCLGLASQGLKEDANEIIDGFLGIIDCEKWDFQEYINSKTFELKGKTKMAYTATGIVFMKQALQFEDVSPKLGL